VITAIDSEGDYKAALREIERLIDRNIRAGASEGDRLNLLTLLVGDYERKRVEIEAPDLIEAIEFRMERMNLAPRDLVPLIGSRSKVSEVLGCRRELPCDRRRRDGISRNRRFLEFVQPTGMRRAVKWSGWETRLSRRISTNICASA
jgi:HTH-type transcriptional regulator/antitoxin HigA